MVKELQYTSIRRVLDNLTEHPLLRDLTLEQVVRHVIRFISLHGYPKLYQDKVIDVEIEGFRGVLPCDLVSIVQVKDLRTGICLRAMGDNFPMGLLEENGLIRHHGKSGYSGIPRGDKKVRKMYRKGETGEIYIPAAKKYLEEPAFKTQGRVIYVTFPEGCVGVAYKAIVVDEDGYPMLLDNENYLAALEAYIKKQVFTVKFDTGKIAAPILQNAKQEYAMLAGELQAEFNTPSVSEAESLTRAYTTLIKNVRQFDNGFKNLGDREYLRKH